MLYFGNEETKGLGVAAEGLILNKLPYKDSHLICKILTRQGYKDSVLFYGGQGGGKKNKPSQLEVGTLISFTPASSKRYSNLSSCKDFKVQWRHESLKNHFRAFFLLNFFVELLDKISVESYDEENLGEEKYFNLLSNAIFYLEDSVKKESFQLNQHLALFLGKLILHNGIYPGYQNCSFCGVGLKPANVSALDFSQGGFSCKSCQEDKLALRETRNSLWEYFATIKNVSYKNYLDVENHPLEALKQVLVYFLGQFQIGPHELKSSSFIFH